MLVGCEGQYCTHFLSYLLGFSNTVSLKATAEKRCSYPMNLVCVCVPAYLPFPNSQRRKACLAGMISLIQQFLLFSRLTGKPSRSVSHGQATVHSLELLLRGNASSHGNSYTGPLNTRLKTAADRLQCVFREPSQTCNFKTFFLILQLGLGNEMKKIIGAK